MSLLARRKLLGYRLQAKRRLNDVLQGHAAVEGLFAGATSLQDVIDMLAESWIVQHPDKEGDDISLPAALAAALAQCSYTLHARRDFTQREHLIVSLARVVLEDKAFWPVELEDARSALSLRCDGLRDELQQRRRSEMNMMQFNPTP
jgi:hypothetical protein